MKIPPAQYRERPRTAACSHLVVAICVAIALRPASLRAQEHENQYVPDSDPLVLQKLEAWQDAKLGLMMTWGLYSQWGIVESWSLCAEDEDWCTRTGPFAADYERYKIAYRGLQRTFSPDRFDPARWASAAREAGMKYLVFTTKHHDGFCMFDTRSTDYRVTSPNCAFHTHPRADITKELFNAFRHEQFMIGAYYSKPDWSSPDYWWPYFPTPDRHVNYDPARYRDRWGRFQDFTFGQIEELMTRYGSVDLLWLDGAWVRPIGNMPPEVEAWAKKKNFDQDIDMPRIAAMARTHQPGLIVVDRWVSGPFENYLTPEQRVAERPLAVPWESCITMATSWSYVRTDTYKSVRDLVRLLANVVARGGNLLLNIGPSPEGEWAPDAYDRLRGLGAWMRVNGEAVYGTRAVAPHIEGKLRLTQKKNGGAVYAIYLPEDGESALPPSVRLSTLQAVEGATVSLLGSTGALQWRNEDGGLTITIPDAMRMAPPCEHAWVLRISAVKRRM